MTKLQNVALASEPERRGAAKARADAAAGPLALVVDDQAGIRSLLIDLLSGQGCRTREAANRAEAEALLRAEAFDAVIVDIVLGPGESGLDLLPLVQETQPFTPAIVISGMANTEHVLQALKAGAYDLLTKPFNIAEVQKAVTNAIEKKTLGMENARLVDELRAERDGLEARVQAATRDLAAKVSALHELNDRLSLIFEMSRARTLDASPTKILERMIGLLGGALHFEDAFCVVFDLRAGEPSLSYATGGRAEALHEEMRRILSGDHAALVQILEAMDATSAASAIREAIIQRARTPVDPRRDMLLPIYVPHTLLGIFGVAGVAQPLALSGAEERLMGFAIGNFLAALEERSFLTRTTQLESFGELVAEIAHDLRHPMTSLRGSVRILNEKWEDEAKRGRCLGQLKTDLSRMESLVSELVNFFNPKDLNMTLVDLHALAEKALEVCRGATEQKNIRIVRDFAAEPAQILGLSRNLIEAFVNVITNGVQWMDEGGALRVSTRSALAAAEQERLRAEGRRPEEFLALEIADSGRGMTPEELAKIFQRFYTTREGGHGLGLPAVHRIVKKNLGVIRAESELGKGSAFTFYLPKA